MASQIGWAGVINKAVLESWLGRGMVVVSGLGVAGKAAPGKASLASETARWLAGSLTLSFGAEPAKD